VVAATGEVLRLPPEYNEPPAMPRGAEDIIRAWRQTEMRSWPVLTIRALAVISSLFSLLGVYLVIREVFLLATGPDANSDIPYLATAFYLRIVIHLALLGALILGSIFVWKLGRLGLAICNSVFAAEIVYFLGGSLIIMPLLTLLGGKSCLFGDSLGATAGIGDMGILPQVLTGYPIIALIVLNLAYRKLDVAMSRGSPAQEPSST